MDRGQPGAVEGVDQFTWREIAASHQPEQFVNTGLGYPRLEFGQPGQPIQGLRIGRKPCDQLDKFCVLTLDETMSGQNHRQPVDQLA